MYHDYYNYKRIAMDEYYENEMQRHKDFAIEAISNIAHFKNKQECFLRVLAYSYFEEHEDAIKLARDMNLSKLEFLAVVEDFDGFKELYLKYQEQQFAQNF